MMATAVLVATPLLLLHAARAPPPPPPERCTPRFREPCPGGQPPLNGSCPCPALNFTNAHGDGMVLQAAPQQAVVWGFCPPGADVTVTFAGRHLKANLSTYLNRSTWSALLPATTATFEPQNITASCCGNATATLRSVLFGDVWVCSGQSNMAYTMGGSTCWTNTSATDPKTYDCTNNSGVENAVAERYNQSIRLYQQGTASNLAQHPPGGCPGRYSCGQGSYEPMAESSPACSDGIPGCSGWGTTTRGVGSFSSVCWFFGRDLHESLPVKVPIGLIEADVGGTPVQDWSPPAAIEECSTFNLTAQQRGFVAGYNLSSVLWNAKIVPLLRTTIKGAVWYQGENNAGVDGREYRCSFAAMIRGWRSIWAATSGTTDPEFAFGFVQLNSVGHPYDYGNTTYRNPPRTGIPPHPTATADDPDGRWSGQPGYPSVRWAQAHALTLPNTFQAVSLDTPVFSGSVHSPYKQPVGARLARGALSVAYGVTKLAGGHNPTAASAMLVKGTDTVRVSLTNLTTAGLLPARRTIGFEILGASGFWNSTPIVSTTATSVTVEGCPSGATVLRYLWYNCPCTTAPFMCPLYVAVPAIGALSGELDSIPIGPFVLAITA